MGVCAGSSSRTFRGTTAGAADGCDGLSATAPVAMAPAPSKAPDISPAVTPRNNVRFTLMPFVLSRTARSAVLGAPRQAALTPIVGTTPVAGELRSHLMGAARAATD